MRLSFAVLATAIATAFASSPNPRQSLPECALSCLASSDRGNCELNDHACMCRNRTFVESTSACITDACKGDDLIVATTVSQQACLAVGITLALSYTATQACASTSTCALVPTGISAALNSESSMSAAMTNTLNTFAGIAAFGLAALAL